MINLQTQKVQLAQALPLNRLHLIHRDIKSYYKKWGKNQVIRLVDSSLAEGFYTFLQYLNRATSAAGASVYLAGEANNNNSHKKIGGTIVIVSLYVELLASYGKEKIFQSEERKRKWLELIKDTENLHSSYEELLEILEPVHVSESLGKLSEVITTLQEEVKELLKEDNGGNLREFTLLNDGPEESTGVKKWFGKLFSSQRHLLTDWQKWENEWEERRSKHWEIKCWIEILQRAIGKYRQGISNNEIEQEIESKILKLKVSEHGEITSTNNSNTLLLNLTIEEMELDDLQAKMQVEKK